MTALTLPSKSTGNAMTLRGLRLSQAGADADRVRRHVRQQHALPVERALADDSLSRCA